MKRTIACLLFTAAIVMGQTAKPEFDAASIKPSGEFVPGVLPVMSGGPGTNDPGRITYTRRTLPGLIALTWNLQNEPDFRPRMA